MGILRLSTAWLRSQTPTLLSEKWILSVASPETLAYQIHFLLDLHIHAMLVFHYGIFKHYWRDLGRVTRVLPPYISVQALHEKVKASRQPPDVNSTVREESFVYRGRPDSCFCDRELVQRTVGRVDERKKGGQSWLICLPIFNLFLSLPPISHHLNLLEYDSEHLEGVREVQQIKIPVNFDRGFHLWGIFEQNEDIDLSCNCQSLRREGLFVGR